MQTLQVFPRQRFEEGEDGFSMGTLLAQFQVAPQFILQPLKRVEGNHEHLMLSFSEHGIIDIKLDQAERQHLHIAGEELTIERFVKPDWAEAISCSSEGLAVTTRSADTVYYWYWHPPEIKRQFAFAERKDQELTWLVTPGFWHNQLSKDENDLKPDWADQAGRDQYGLYADVTIAGVMQRFRWIQPCSFMMGSPEDENGRYDDETPHQVSLSQGCWLADTACTQALWHAVTRENPSHFNGAYRPVDGVSWNDVQQFLDTINQQHPGLNPRLPSEAEWEYACRAGATGAFNFEGELSLKKVNYRGTWEYESDKWGEGALQQTAEVKSYPANTWGLFEMHGNVWEWCQDWYGICLAQSMTDPLGTDTGDDRVLRGGSWLYHGGHCRSAGRGHFLPDDASRDIGFRLARDHKSGQAGPGADQQPDGQREESELDFGLENHEKKSAGLFDVIKSKFKNEIPIFCHSCPSS